MTSLKLDSVTYQDYSESVKIDQNAISENEKQLLEVELSKIFESVINLHKKIWDDSSCVFRRTELKSERKQKNQIGILTDFHNDAGIDEKTPQKTLHWQGVVGRIKWTEIDNDIDLSIDIRTPFEKEGKYYFMAYLLMNAFGGSSNTAPFGASVTYDDLFHFLYIYLFKDKLKKAYSAGPYKKYETFERNDDRVRGHIDVARHIKLNMGLANGKIAYSYRERTADNSINRLILHTFEMLRQLYPKMVSSLLDSDSDFDAILRSIEFGCPSWRSENVRTAASRSVMPITQPLYQDYEDLRKLCLRILSGEGISVFGEDSDETISNTILFYVPDIWEMYLEKLIQRAIDDINSGNGVPQLKLDSQAEVKIIGGIANRRPDFVVYGKDENGEDAPYAVIDAKFKKHYDEVQEGKVFSSYPDDLTQCLSYSAILNCNRIGIIFPYSNEIDENGKEIVNTFKPYKHYISNYNKDSYFGFIGLCVPTIKDDDTFDSWREKIKTNEDQVITNIIDLLTDKYKDNDK